MFFTIRSLPFKIQTHKTTININNNMLGSANPCPASQYALAKYYSLVNTHYTIFLSLLQIIRNYRVKESPTEGQFILSSEPLGVAVQWICRNIIL